MDRAFGGKRRSRKPAINITPLIDVVFLLLIFFMVSSTFRQTPGIAVALPEAQTAEALTEDRPREVTVRADGTIHYDQRPVDRDGLRDALRELMAAEPEVGLVLRADKAAPFQAGLLVMDVAREVGFDRLEIPTRPDGEP